MFDQYKRKQISEARPVLKEDIEEFTYIGKIFDESGNFEISISDTDLKNGSPKIGDMIGRNPQNHSDQWLIAKEYFQENFEKIEWQEIR